VSPRLVVRTVVRALFWSALACSVPVYLLAADWLVKHS